MGVGEEHQQTVNADSKSAGGGKAVFKCPDVVQIHPHGLVVVFAGLDLVLETSPLLVGVDQFGIAVAEFAAGANRFEAFRHAGNLAVVTRQWRDLLRIVDHERGLPDTVLHRLLVDLQQQLAGTISGLHINTVLFSKRA